MIYSKLHRIKTKREKNGRRRDANSLFFISTADLGAFIFFLFCFILWYWRNPINERVPESISNSKERLIEYNLAKSYSSTNDNCKRNNHINKNTKTKNA